MRPRLVWGTVIVAVILVGGLCVWLFPAERETYEGQPLAFWLSEVDFNRPPDRRETAAKALRAMGPRIIPRLLDDLDPRESVWQRYKRWLAGKQTFLKLKVPNRNDQMRQAVWAFDALGTNALLAIPEILKLLDSSPGYAAGALVGVREPAIPAIQQALRHTNRYVRSNLGVYLANAIEAEKISREATRPLVPSLLRNLKDTNANVRRNTASALGSIHLEPSLCIPELIKGLGDTDPEVQSRCAQALCRFGDDAGEAIPSILQLYEGARSDRRLALCNSVKYFRSAPHLVVPGH